MNSKNIPTIEKLDLTSHIDSFNTFLSREKELFIEGDQERHYKFITALEKLEFKAAPKVEYFHNILAFLNKKGVLRFEQIFSIIKILRYFRYFKNRSLDGLLGEWFSKIEIPREFSEIESYFNEDGKFEESKDEQLYGLNQRISTLKGDISSSMKRLVYSSKLASYLVDTQIHYINEEETLLVRGGFNHVLKGSVVGRSSGGFFYVSPDSITKTKEQIRHINQEREALFYEYAKTFSTTMYSLTPFIKFVDKEFDKLDHYQARVLYARAYNMQIIQATSNSDCISLNGFKHPALSNAKSVDVDFNKNVLMITGVNAGGKTMLLKSILSAAFMAKYLIPMKIDKHKSHIGSFKQVEAVIDDPQNVKNDISTFAGRMLQFTHLFSKHSALIGVDEIELGTDSDEAAALFKVILDELIKKGSKIVVTTHHKRLAALMADRDDVDLMAAIYDEEKRLPTYEFLHGIIGKSYAFETAIRYGIKPYIVDEARTLFGENHEKLNMLIERGSELERELKKKNFQVDERIAELQAKEQELKEKMLLLESELLNKKARLKHSYQGAIDEAKKAVKGGTKEDIHRAMNKASKQLPQDIQVEPSAKKNYNFKVGDKVKYRSKNGLIISLKSKEATVEVEGMRLRVKLHELKPSGNQPKKPHKAQIQRTTEKRGGLKLDLHGLYAEEALEKLDVFLSDALINGFDEVIIYHGIGTGKLSYAVKEFLKVHPSVIKYEDAPAHMGGFGAKVVTL
ncbi:MAG: endonuclease MutS2 [Helicobacteraceae bacterium]|nr:endonuclease MutS2 [Helicobacteraceae bacterium]